MKNLGKKDRRYPSMAEPEESKMRYPSVVLPLSILNGKEINLDEKVTLSFKGRIERVEKSEWSQEFTVELKEGEIILPKAKSKTLIS